MISKTNTSKSFARTINYLLNDPKRYEVVLCHGVREEKLGMTKDFELQNGLNKRCKMPVLHVIVSHHPNDKGKAEISELQILQDWINKLRDDKGIDLYSTQFSIVKHHEREHLHYHMVINLVSNSGKRLKIDHVGLKMKDVSKQVTKQYSLTPAVKKIFQLSTIENNYDIKKGIRQVMNGSATYVQMNKTDLLQQQKFQKAKQLRNGINK
jgi:hypothetical protein